MKAVIFTYPRDYGIATVGARALMRVGVSPVLAIDVSDPIPEIEGVECITTDFKRGGNLNGTVCVRGILATLASQADGDRYVLKVDSDTLVRGLRWLEGRDECAVGLRHTGIRDFYGACYALRVDRLDEYRRAAEAMPHDPGCPEDVTIGTMLPGAFTFQNRAAGCPFQAWRGERDLTDASKEVIIFNPGDRDGARVNMKRLME